MRERDSGSELAEKQKEQEQEQQQPGNYVLRENPRKTKRFVDSKEQKVCKECGKGFQSLKALCGHMACHSDKERVSNKVKEERLVMDGHSDTETSGPRPRRAWKRIRYKSLGGSGIEQEQEEVAISLMLLSRDCGGGKGGPNSVAESSSNNSVILEAKSPSIDMMIIGAKKVTSFDEDVVAKKEGKLKSDAKISVSENSDSGYFKNGPKKIESDVSVDGFVRNGELKKMEVESGSGFDAKFRTCVDKSELEKNLVDEEGKDQENRGSSKYELRKRSRSGICKTEALSTYFKNEVDYASNGEICRNGQKRSKYECLTCNKTFHSHTALGGHRASHAKINGCGELICESGENSIETDNSGKLIHENGTGKAQINGGFTGNADRKSGSKKSKGHECPICFRMFKSGQALGGHKRSHFVGGREANSTTVVRQEPAPEAEITVLFDLNLPAPMEEDVDGMLE